MSNEESKLASIELKVDKVFWRFMVIAIIILLSVFGVKIIC